MLTEFFTHTIAVYIMLIGSIIALAFVFIGRRAKR